ncbi:hypothetical protein H4R18_005774 [Coemansia javaensis]|uniref:BHLH domain-containing protein n=1 Tax=Coemansia javaensis TaxID=2761396 RepID=A0A9W8LF23_9FUNG|nr:hypothetical protein H4R18_005774 [Coemansia javaensis]
MYDAQQSPAHGNSVHPAGAAGIMPRRMGGACYGGPGAGHRPGPAAGPGVARAQRAAHEHPVPELVGERDGDDDDEDESGDDESGDHGDKAGPSSAKLRTIHKLAERRRRREMKALFDALRRSLPIDKTIRVSKWETLKKAIEVIASQEAEIRMLRAHMGGGGAVVL